MNQVFTKKKLAAALTLAFATGGAAVLATAPVPGFVAEAHANTFTDTTNASAASAGVTVPVSATASLAGQQIAFTETVVGGVFDGSGTIKLKLNNGKWISGTLPTATIINNPGTPDAVAVALDGTDTTNKTLIVTYTNNTANTAAVTVKLTGITLDTSGLAVGTDISATVDSTSTLVGLTTGTTLKLATTSGAAVTITSPTATKVAAGAASGNLPSFSFTENITSSVGSTAGAIKLSLKNGYTWTTRPDVAISGSGGPTMSNGTGTAVTGQGAADATYQISAQTSGTNKATFTFGGVTPGAVFVPVGSTGDIAATLTVLDQNQAVIASQDITLSNVVTKGLTAAAAQVTGKTGFDAVYTGRIYDAASDFTTKNLLQVKEALAGSVAEGSTVSFTYGAGKWMDDAATPAALTNKINATAATGKEGYVFGTCTTTSTAPSKLSCPATETGAANGATAADISYGLRGINTIGAAVGDLTVLVESNSSSSPTAVKIAEIKDATTATLSGAAPTLIPGATAVAIPDVVITEAAAGALATGNLALRLPSGVTFSSTAVPTVTVTKADGTALTGKVTAPSTASFLDSGAEFQLAVAAQSSSTEGAMTIKISGLKVSASSSASTGNVSMTLFGVATGGTTSVADDRSTSKKDAGAKPTKKTLTAASVVSNTAPTIAVTTTGAITNQTISGSVVASGNDQGKLGMIYVAANVPNAGVYLKNSAGAWVAYNPAAPVAYAGPVNLSTTAVEVTNNLDLSSIVGTEIYVGYGLGSTAFGVTVPWNNMLSSGTYSLVYTVK